MNNFTAIGRVGRDAVTRHTSGGKAVTGWSLAVDKGWGDNKQTTWLDCSLWGDRGQKLAEMIRKGDRLGVSGEIGTREHDGKTYVTLDVRDVTLLGDKNAPRGETKQPTVRQKNQGVPDDFDDSDAIPF